MQRVVETYERVIWLNPQAQDTWEYSNSVQMVNQLLDGRMFPLTLRGLDEGVSYLGK